MVDGKHLWAQVYYLLRTGRPQDASELLSEHTNSLKREDYTLPGALKAYSSSPNSTLPKQQKDALYNDYNTSIRNNPNVDQFKFAIYKLVGRFELGKKNLKVARTTEDWVWVQLNLIREGNGGEGGGIEEYGLDDFGKSLVRFGADKFDQGGQRPMAWFNLLLYSGQFERVRPRNWSIGENC
jgi:nuclear pore complex protein Nup93